MNILTTAKRNPTTRIKFFQESVRPLELQMDHKEYQLPLEIDKRLLIEIENNSSSRRDYVFCSKDASNKILFISRVYRISSKEHLRIKNRSQVDMPFLRQADFVVTKSDLNTSLYFYSVKSKNEDFSIVRSLDELKRFRLNFKVNLKIS
ncbi:MAG: hypothetical protein ACRCXZ_09965 [Patescibacteria group bacterium]